jgi:hypothetical protein
MVRVADGAASTVTICAALLLLSGCGGKVIVGGDGTASSGDATTGSTDPCATPSTPFGSFVALKLAYCQPELPPSARLLQINSSPNGDVDAQGSSGIWRMTFRDADADHPRYRIEASPLGVQVQVGDGDLTCSGEELDPFDSEVVVPDLIARFAEHDPYEGGVANFFAFQTTACLATEVWPEGRIVTILRVDPTVSPDTPGNWWWFASYSGENAFEKLCGPCAQGSGASCSPCFQ